ncbi:MAG: hypothetical protein R3B70_09850 [Polyangiaceae bacterium]
MNRNHALATIDLFVEHDDEVSSIRPIPTFDVPGNDARDPQPEDTRFDLEIDVEISPFSLDRGFDEPTPVYAQPFALVGGRRCEFEKRAYLGTRFPGGIIESGEWEEDLREAGGSDRAVERCRQYLAENTM